jgi:hypothetical protein
MANTIVGFTIQIDGVNSINELNAKIKETKAQMNALDMSTEGADDQFKELGNTLGRLTAEQKGLRKQQDDLNKSFMETSKSLGAYDKLSAKLNRLRKEYKNLAVQGKDTTAEGRKMRAEIDRLDDKLKEVDASTGQFQRSVGNYPRVFGMSAKSVGQFIPGLDKLSARMDKLTGGTNVMGKAFIAAFVVFKAGQAIAKVITEINKLQEVFRETSNTVQEFSDASGTSLDRLTVQTKAIADTFEVEAKDISAAAASIASNLGISFDEALNKVESGLLTTTKSSQDFLTTLEEYPETFDEITGSISDYSNAQQNVLNANKELAKSQQELTMQFGGVSEGVEVLKTRIISGLIQAFLYVLKILKPIIAAFKTAGVAVANLFKNISTATGSVNAFSVVMDILSRPLKLAGFLLTQIANAITFFADGITFLIREIPIVATVFQAFYDISVGVSDFFTNLPFIFAGVVASLKQLGANFLNFFKILAIDADIFANQVANSFGGQFDAYIKKRQAERAALKDEAQTAGKAYTDAYNAAKTEAQRVADAEAAAQAKAIALENQAAAAKIEKEKTAERAKAAREAAKKNHEQLMKDREKFLQDEAKYLDQVSKLALNLQARTNALLLDAIKDEQQKARAIERKGLEDRLAQAQGQYDSLIELQQAREAEALRLYGANSQELAALRELNATQAGEAEMELGNIIIKERLKTQDALRGIDAKFEQATVNERKAAFNNRANAIRSEADMLKTIAERQKVEGVISEEEYQQELYDIEKDRIDKELLLLKQRQSFEDMLKKAGIETSESESTAILSDKEKLYLDLAKLDANHTAKNNANEKARLAAAKDANKERLEDFQAKFELAAQIGVQLLEIFDGFLEVTNERRMKRIEEDESNNAKQLEDLNERLQTATGLEKRFLEQQVTDNAVAADQIAKDKEKAEKERAKQEKARSIIEAVIATALAIIKALPNIPLSIIAGVTGAASIATIAAQPLAEGGVVGKGDDIVQFNNGGRVTSKGNIKPLSNGDNVLATLKTGEIVLNKGQQRKIGYKSLKSAGIPNFAGGGLVGAPTSIIQTANEDTALAKRNLELLQSGIEATNARFDRLQVNWTANTEENADKGRTDRKEIRANAQF